MAQSLGVTLEEARPDPVSAAGAVIAEERPSIKQDDSAEPSQEAVRLECQGAEAQQWMPSIEADAFKAKAQLGTIEQHSHAVQQADPNVQQVCCYLLCFLKLMLKW